MEEKSTEEERERTGEREREREREGEKERTRERERGREGGVLTQQNRRRERIDHAREEYSTLHGSAV